MAGRRRRVIENDAVEGTRGIDSREPRLRDVPLTRRDAGPGPELEGNLGTDAQIPWMAVRLSSTRTISGSRYWNRRRTSFKATSRSCRPIKGLLRDREILGVIEFIKTFEVGHASYNVRDFTMEAVHTHHARRGELPQFAEGSEELAHDGGSQADRDHVSRDSSLLSSSLAASWRW